MWCVGELRKLMPNRLSGRCVEPGQVQAEAKTEERAALKMAGTPHTPTPRGPNDIPAPSWCGPPKDARDLQSRYLDGVQALSTWQAKSLTADGMSHGAAMRKAEKFQQSVAARGVADASTR